MKKVLIGAGIITIILVMILLNLYKSQEETESGSGVFGGSKGQPVAVEVVGLGDLSSSVLVNGLVQEVHKKDMFAVSSLKVTSLSVDVGDEVREGDVLYTIDLSGLEDELASLKLNREIQALTLEKIQNVSTTASSKGAQVALELAKINVASAENYLAGALENVEKNKALYDEGIISKTEYESLEKAVDEAQSQVDVAKLNMERSESDLSQLYSSNSASKESLEYDVQIQLKNLESMDMSIRKIEKQIQEIHDSTKAEMTGVVTMRNLEVGDTTVPGSPLFQIMDMTKLEVVANVREFDIREMVLGQDVKFTGDAIGKDQEVTGKLTYIAPVAASLVINGRQTTGIEIKMDISHGTEYLKPGYSAECEIMTETANHVIVGNFNMFREDNEGNRIAFVVEDGIIRERTIETGISSDFEMEIISGLEEGDLVVSNPSLALKEGMRVEITNDYMGDMEEGN